MVGANKPVTYRMNGSSVGEGWAFRDVILCLQFIGNAPDKSLTAIVRLLGVIRLASRRKQMIPTNYTVMHE